MIFWVISSFSKHLYFSFKIFKFLWACKSRHESFIGNVKTVKVWFKNNFKLHFVIFMSLHVSLLNLRYCSKLASILKHHKALIWIDLFAIFKIIKVFLILKFASSIALFYSPRCLWITYWSFKPFFIFRSLSKPASSDYITFSSFYKPRNNIFKLLKTILKL